MNILFIGDIFGKPGRASVARWISPLKVEYAIDVVVANAENAAGGLGATPELLDELRSEGVQAFTFGNHTWRKKSMVKAIDKMADVVRPANYPDQAPGKGSLVLTLGDGRKLGLINLIGRVYMEPFGCPFATADEELDMVSKETSTILVDMHAEATAEKVAIGWHLDGRCTAVVGTHTHIQTADERVLPEGTGYITDVGMTGPQDSVIGVKKELIVQKFITGMPTQFEVATDCPGIRGVVIETDDETGKTKNITRIARDDE
jgi:hypothetical protein